MNAAMSIRNRFVLVALALASAAASAADAATPEAGIAQGLAALLLIVAAGGAAYITLSLAGVGWNVGAKFIKRLGSKA